MKNTASAVACMVVGGLLSLAFDVVTKEAKTAKESQVQSVQVESGCKCGVVKSCECSPVVEKSAPVEKTITLYWREGCVPCAKWKSVELERFRSAGYKVLEARDTQNAVPWFRIKVGDKESIHTGYLSLESAQAIVARK